MKALALLPLLVACGSDPSHSPDAPVAHDAAIDSRPDAHPDAQPDARSGATDGLVEVTQGIGDGSASTSVDANFGMGSFFGPQIGTDGPCTIYSVAQDLPGYSAGTITITGTTSPVTIDANGTAPSVSYSPSATVPKPLYTAGATITVTAAGGPDVGAFTASFTAPTTLAGYTAPTTSISRAGYPLTWTASTAPMMWVIMVAYGTTSSDTTGVICRVDDNGAFTVPASTFAMVPATETNAFAGLGRISPTTMAVGGTMVTVQGVSFVTSGQITLTN